MHIPAGHIEELVLTSLLKDGPLKTTKLLEKAFRKHHYTKQGVYRVLRKLKKEEKVVIYKSVVSINNLWREQWLSLFTADDSNVSVIGNVRGLKRGDRLSLKLKGLHAADQIWSHLFVPIEKELTNTHPLFLYNPHNWTFLLREETDRIHAERFVERGRPTYLLVGSSTLDKAVTQTMQFKYLEYSFTSNVPYSAYITVIGEYVFEMKLTGNGNARMDSVFREDDVEIARNLLEKFDQQFTFRIVIEKNPAKATQWKKRIGKDFYIPKKYKNF